MASVAEALQNWFSQEQMSFSAQKSPRLAARLCATPSTLRPHGSSAGLPTECHGSVHSAGGRADAVWGSASSMPTFPCGESQAECSAGLHHGYAEAELTAGDSGEAWVVAGVR